MTDHRLLYIKSIVKSITCAVFDKQLRVVALRDRKAPVDGRIYIQIQFNARDAKFPHNRAKTFNSRKWYLSDHMPEDEIVKTIYLAYETCVRHEVMEGFKVNGITLFNPHVDYKELLKISNKEVKR